MTALDELRGLIEQLSPAGKLRFAADLLDATPPRPELAAALAHRVAVELSPGVALAMVERVTLAGAP